MVAHTTPFTLIMRSAMLGPLLLAVALEDCAAFSLQSLKLGLRRRFLQLPPPVMVGGWPVEEFSPAGSAQSSSYVPSDVLFLPRSRKRGLQKGGRGKKSSSFDGASNAGTPDLPSDAPSYVPSDLTLLMKSDFPSFVPSDLPSVVPSDMPSFAPSDLPSSVPSDSPSSVPSDFPSSVPSDVPSSIPSDVPSSMPSDIPSSVPSDAPSSVPSDFPSSFPSDAPSSVPSDMPSSIPSDVPSSVPSDMPSSIPSDLPSSMPSDFPSSMPSDIPSTAPSEMFGREAVTDSVSLGGADTIMDDDTVEIFEEICKNDFLPTYLPVVYPAEYEDIDCKVLSQTLGERRARMLRESADVELGGDKLSVLMRASADVELPPGVRFDNLVHSAFIEHGEEFEKSLQEASPFFAPSDDTDEGAPSSAQREPDSGKNKDVPIIVGALVGGAVIGAILAFVLYNAHRRKKTRGTEPEAHQVSLLEDLSSFSVYSDGNLAQTSGRLSVDVPPVQELS